jgi:predicted DNA-binding transcriptional regulator AlpA
MTIFSSIKLLNAHEVSEILGISESSVYQLTKEGLLGYIKILPSRKSFTEDLVREFLEAQTVRRHVTRPANDDYPWAKRMNLTA